jgi:microprocessor complex subunit DGCR8
MHIYLHRQSRVCTLARPYFLGPGSVRKHEIPLSAIPCLQYQKLLEREAELEREKEEGLCFKRTIRLLQNSLHCDGKYPYFKFSCLFTAAVADVGNAEDDVDGSKPASGSVLPPKVKVETVNDFVRKSLSAAELREYCAKRFEFKTITVRRYR